jgi:hypothetical protein
LLTTAESVVLFLQIAYPTTKKERFRLFISKKELLCMDKWLAELGFAKGEGG